MENQDKLFDLMTRMYGEMQNGFKEVKGEITEIKSEMTEMKGEVTELKSEMTEMKGEVTELKGEMTEMKGEVTELKGEMTEVKGEMGQIKIRLDKLENTVTIIEQDHGRKLSVLFDGYKQNAEKLDRIENEVSKQEEVILRKIR